MRLVLISLALAGCGASSTPASAPTPSSAPTPVADPATDVDAAPMASFELNGYTLTGAEYWPYAGTADIDYPKDVLWGFYPKAGELAPGESEPNAADASPAALACARTSYEALRAFLSTQPAALKAIIEAAPARYVPKFYLWTNDYTRAATPYPPGVREARLWYWQRKTPDPARPPGYWKWEATVTQTGECQVPRQPQIDQYLAETHAALATR